MGCSFRCTYFSTSCGISDTAIAYFLCKMGLSGYRVMYIENSET
jgi:hypothetical protein